MAGDAGLPVAAIAWPPVVASIAAVPVASATLPTSRKKVRMETSVERYSVHRRFRRAIAASVNSPN
jgi:hypothetical protein